MGKMLIHEIEERIAELLNLDVYAKDYRDGPSLRGKKSTKTIFRNLNDMLFFFLRREHTTHPTRKLTSSLMGVKEIELLWCMVMISSLKSSSDTISDVPRIDFMSESV